MPETDFAFCCNFLDVVLWYVRGYLEANMSLMSSSYPNWRSVKLIWEVTDIGPIIILNKPSHRRGDDGEHERLDGKLTPCFAAKWATLLRLSCFRIQIVELIFKNCPCTFVPILFRVCVLIFARQDVSFICLVVVDSVFTWNIRFHGWSCELLRHFLAVDVFLNLSALHFLWFFLRLACL